jgi:7-cyano-7-deazaguanine reductase
MLQTHMLELSPLGKNNVYVDQYDPSLLFSIPRLGKRQELNISNDLPFQGVDVWTAYEISWLDLKGKPNIAIGEFHIPANSHSIIESKSLKLYLNSFNQTRLASLQHLKELIKNDLEKNIHCPVSVNLFFMDQYIKKEWKPFDGECLDDLDIDISDYNLNSSELRVSDELVEETLFSHLLKSNCLVTGQPDWGSIWIHYKGLKIDRHGFLKYLVSFRNHHEFHEQCIERIFTDLLRYCNPKFLTVYGRYTRRGGIDINPFRSNWENFVPSYRDSRQ